MIWRISSSPLLTEAVASVLLAAVGVEGEVELPPEESSVVCVDQLKHALVDDVRLQEHKHVYPHCALHC